MLAFIFGIFVGCIVTYGLLWLNNQIVHFPAVGADYPRIRADRQREMAYGKPIPKPKTLREFPENSGTWGEGDTGRWGP